MKTNNYRFLMLSVFFLAATSFSVAQKKAAKTTPKTTLKSATFNGLSFRSVGPALTSGRIVDLAINPNNSAEYFVAVACGGVWKTSNAGITYTPSIR